MEKRIQRRENQLTVSGIAILGSGMAGFGAAYRLHTNKLDSKMYDEKSYFGGHTASFKFDNGFIFDDGPHISFTKNERIQKLFAESVNQEFQTIQAQANNYWRGYWIKHPAQCNLHGLPSNLVVDILCDFIEAQHQNNEGIETYADWLLASFGKTFATVFPMEYGLKYHTTTADNMSIDWLGPRVYRPELKEVLRGALSPQTADVHYIDHFRYPTNNGFGSYLKMFLEMTQLRLNHQLVRVDPENRVLKFAKGETASYDHIISSIPLPELIPMISGVPDDVVEAANKLAFSTVVIVNIGIDRDDISEAHWTYFYDQDYFFTRLSFPHMLSRGNVPRGAGSIQAEVYYSKKYRPLDRTPEECIEPVVADLRRCQLIKENDTILFTNATIAPYANVIFDLDRVTALTIVHGYLNDIGIVYCGRYGEWGYHWTDEAFVSGENAAQKVIDSITS